jgi:predicted RNase H-like nuclease (RuvC/YqgF family)
LAGVIRVGAWVGWAGELETAKEFVKEITAVKRGLRHGKGGVSADALKRPLLGEVLERLKHIEDSVLRQTVE